MLTCQIFCDCIGFCQVASAHTRVEFVLYWSLWIWKLPAKQLDMILGTKFGTIMGMIGLELIILCFWTAVLPRACRENAGNSEFKISVETEAWNISLPLLQDLILIMSWHVSPSVTDLSVSVHILHGAVSWHSDRLEMVCSSLAVSSRALLERGAWSLTVLVEVYWKFDSELPFPRIVLAMCA